MKQKLFVVKIGGKVIDDDASLKKFLSAFAKLEGSKILVHGGGKLATQIAEQMNIPQQIIEGRRITDEATLKIVTMVYAGYINKNITAQLQAADCNAIGLSGADGNLLQAHKRTNTQHDYGFAGDVDTVNTTFIDQLLQAGVTLVVAPITHDKKGQLLNTNADTIAQELAQTLSKIYETQLIYCFEKSGVLHDIADENSCIASINKNNFQSLIDQGVIYAGMLPKLHNAFAALDRGVYKVVIGKWEQLRNLTQGKSGTMITHE